MEIWNNHLDEREAFAAANAIMHCHVSEGDIVDEFERQLAEVLGIPYVVAACNGTAALMLACMAAGVQPGDEVIVPDLTFIATANAPKALGAVVVACEVDRVRPLMDVDSVMELITDKTKAIIPVHLNGRLACTEELKKKLHARKIAVIDDACQAFMSGDGMNTAGSRADIACFSFGITKTLAAGQGGAAVTNDKSLYLKMKQLKRQGVNSIFECSQYEMPGVNFKMSDILASIGIVQLTKLSDKISNMKNIHKLYLEGLSDINGIHFIDTMENELIWMPDLYCNNRDKVRKIMEENGIVVRPLGSCLHTAPYIEARQDYVNASEFAESVLYLPSGPDQKLENIYHVIDIFRKHKNEFFTA